MCMASFMMPYALHLIVSQGAVQLFQSSQSSSAHSPSTLPPPPQHTETSQNNTNIINTNLTFTCLNMGCLKVGHSHAWPTRGTLTIQRCEVRCNFCTGDAGLKDWKYAWFLRRHVRAIHVKKGLYKGLRVDCGWNDEIPRDADPAMQGLFKQEFKQESADDAGYVPQNTRMENNQLPLPDFVPQIGHNNFGAGAFNGQDLSNQYMTDEALLELIKREERGDVQVPTLGDEDVHGDGLYNQTPRAVTEFEAFLTDCLAETGYVEDEQTGDITDLTDHPTPTDEPPLPIAPGRFYMPDVTATDQEEDQEEDRPLAEIMRVGVPMEHDAQHNHLMSMLSQVSSTMQAQGVQVNEMLPTIEIFIRSLVQSSGL
ncbi:unnamed protein product [Zymoseptoria tritici ST99CH_3D7]|uniref:C2H2-type domain-containing protein n=1 Tax=Zymoseptoria tritici (strain ST99CH_3D7) TaxID=1276538 RepID=A0A1X7RFG7_ZYMT9|nr:unnamed protein product [Zymoseptoria tritici ST99CH_3D7]